MPSIIETIQSRIKRYKTKKKEEREKRKVERKRDFKRSRDLYILLAPYFILFFIFTVLPVAISLIFSFTYFNMLEFPKWAGWENYRRLFFEDDVFLIAIKNTIMFAVITGPLGYLGSFVFAWLVNELKPKVRSFMTLIIYAPSISGGAYIIWRLIFSGDMYGYANAFLIRFGIVLEPIQWLQNPDYIPFIIILVQLWLSLGVSFLAFIAGLQGVDRTLYEAGAVDGIKNRWQELWYITLPSIKPQLMFSAVIQITASLAISEVAMNIAGFPSVEYAGHTIVTHLIDVGNLRFEMGYASAIATILFVMMLGSNLLVQKMLRRVGT
ncbi:MAG: sugar ABC transporter permease [Acholeplasma sp.]|jgi:multiple sugar transport system permease protein|nr:MAG: sugar ABC transporter permease [Acholeplasma sp.]